MIDLTITGGVAGGNTVTTAKGAATQCRPANSTQTMHRSVFETPDYQTIYGADNVVEIDAGAGRSLTFADKGNHAICLARTSSFDEAEIGHVCEALFADRRFRFAVFEDVDLDASFRVPAASLSVHYQNDWVLGLEEMARDGLRASFKRDLDKKMQRLTREFANARLSIERPSREIAEGAIEFNRKRIEAERGTYGIDDAKRERLVAAMLRVGTASVLRDGDRFVSAWLFVECDLEAYAILGGYDEAYHRNSPGMQTLRHGVEHFAARGFRAVHLMWGDGPYKERIGARRVPLSTLIVPRSPGEWLGRSILREAGRYGLKDVKRRVKRHGWIVDCTREMAAFTGKIATILHL